tara:strand:- start:871 stop:1236 length:366 start_codon:yes stop_codon:yes gene_type:complete
MKIFKYTTLYIMSIFYVNVGVKHFVDPDWFMQIMPPYLPYHKELVYISGMFEILFGLMLIIQRTRLYAGYGLILLLIAVFPANIYLAQTNGSAMNISPEIAWGRLPFQALFISFAYMHSKM